jgi:SAM-dependent methyltransferase
MFAAADAYERHVGRYGEALGRRLIEAARLQAGDQALDVGCGTGKLTGELVKLLGVENVAAIDPSPPFAARVRAKFPGVRVEGSAAESIPFEDAAFDASFAQLVVNFMGNARKGVGEMKRVTRPGGSVVAAVWDYGDGMTLLRRFWDAAAATDPNSDPQDELNMRYATAGELATLWSDVGLADIRTFAADVPASYADFEDLWHGFEQGVGPAGAYAVSISEEQRGRLKDEYRRLLGTGDAPFDLTARAWVVTGRVPAT